MDMMNGGDGKWREDAAWCASIALALAVIIPLLPAALLFAAADAIRGHRRGKGA